MNERSNSSSTSPGSNWRSILLIRHGATALNSKDQTRDRIRGWTDWPLSEGGMDEAWMLAKRIAIPPDILFCSNLTRARKTAEIIANNFIISLRIRAAFLPWNIGMYVGANAAETVPKLAQFAIRTPYASVPDGESFNTFRTRFLLGLLKALHEHEGLIGIVTHHRNERLLKAWAKAGYPENGAIDEAEFTKKGDPTGHCEVIQIPIDRLELYSHWVRLQHAQPAFGDGREESWLDWINR